MEARRFTGPSSGSQKYDILTAMAVAGLNGSPGFQVSMLRLIAVVTARYNWRADELTVGQKELARMWAVDERTVKREIKRLTQAAILLQLRPGVRGRVAAYRLNMAEISRLSETHWLSVGPDFADRMTQLRPAQPEDKPESKVVRLPVGAVAAPKPDSLWDRILARLEKTDPALCRNWFALLSVKDSSGPVLRLHAPSTFVAQYVQTHHMQRLLDSARLEAPQLRRVLVEA